LIHDRFDGAALDLALWVDHYLPQWTTPDRSAARYDLTDHGLRLRIDADQPAWRPEDGRMRVSSIQTGTFSGPLGSTVGTHRHRPDGLVVRTPQPTRRLWTPSGGSVQVTATASPDPTCMLGIWLVGFEADSPEQSGEICLAELFGDRIGPHRSTIRLGVKAHNDPRLSWERNDLELDLDATGRHTYGAEWGPNGIRFLVDGTEVARSDQVVDYPQQLMIDLFEFPESDERPAAEYPKSAYIHLVRGDSS
jgi:hypothetical protein